jgi:ligand-binding SRPBCC domain-containing protein
VPVIHLTTVIHAPVERVFDISRNVDLHKKSMAHTNEQATAGTYTGLLSEGDIVTWKAKHLRKDRFLKVRISKLEKYSFFVDEMLQGDFAAYRHEHYFKPIINGTIVINILTFETPYGLLGVFLNKLFLVKYMRNLLEHRLNFIKNYAEAEVMKASVE